MKTASTVCGNCGDKILGDAPKGLCLACVLETGLGPLADETVAGVADSPVAAYSSKQLKADPKAMFRPFRRHVDRLR